MEESALQTHSTSRSQQHSEKSNKNSSLSKMESLLGYYFQTKELPPIQHITVASLVKKKSQGGNQIIIQDRAAIKYEEIAQIKYQYREVVVGSFIKTERLCARYSTTIKLPRVTPEVETKIRVWRQDVQEGIQMANLNNSPNDSAVGLISYLLPTEAKEVVQGHTNINSLLEAVCCFYERKQCSAALAAPFQENFLFIRDYYEAVQRRVLKNQDASFSDEKTEELVYAAFLDGLTPETVQNSLYVSCRTCKEYVNLLEDIEKRLIEDLQKKYNGREHSKRDTPIVTATLHNPQKERMFCAIHRRYCMHSTEECLLRKKKEQAKSSSAQSLAFKNEPTKDQTEKINDTAHQCVDDATGPEQQESFLSLTARA
ncbi:hypothetical protein NEAUS05_1902 [Nematocida ausubeli]|nr:hypothetical protein NEAUS05_1902 [Nematocida ausubeli]